MTSIVAEALVSVRPPPDLGTRRAWIVDAAGGLIAAALATWLLVAAADRAASALPAVSVLGASALAYAVARVAGFFVPWLVPTAVVLAVSWLIAIHAGDVLSGVPMAQPLGYANANAALMAQGTAAALVVALVWRAWPFQMLSVAAASILLLAAFASGSFAAPGSLLLLLPMAVVAAWSGRRAIVIVLATAVVAAVVFTTLVGAGAAAEPDPSWISVPARVFSERRVELWSDAWTVAREHPLTGVGPGRLGGDPSGDEQVEFEPAHDEFLQFAAEAGFPAMALLVGVFLWGLIRLGTGRLGPQRAVGAVAVAALGLHASIDHVLHFPAVPMAAAAVLGAAVATRRAAETP